MSQNIAVCSHSTPNTYTVFSVSQGIDVLQDIIANDFITDYMNTNNISYKLINGSYNGYKEISYIINSTNLPVLLPFINEKYNQECYMLLEQHKHGLCKAYFADSTGEKMFQGYLREVPESVAKTQRNYSHRPDIDKYWIITKEDTTQNLGTYFETLTKATFN